MSKKPFYVTTPIYYVNGQPHLGSAYTTIACDVLARFMRMDGHDVRFLTGTDEHGQKVAKAAQDAGQDPKAYVDDLVKNFQALAKAMGTSNDDFIRTTEPRHIQAAQALWNELEKRGDIYLGSYAGWYAVRDEAFYTEDELRDGPGGRKIAPSGAECEWVEEPSYFFRLSAWQDRLLEHYQKHPDFIRPSFRRNEVISFVKSGLRDLSISRTTFTWGIPVPDQKSEGPRHIMYVWMDALTNYIAALGYPDTQAPLYRHFWPNALHVVGKDILRFHAVYWPAFLMAAGLELPNKGIFAHGWWTAEGEKMSKSLGNVIDPIELVRSYGLDPVRYFLMREVPFGQDGDFSKAALIHRINGNLANDLGNLAQRVLVQIQRNCDGVMPDPEELHTHDEALLGPAYGLLPAVRDAMDDLAFHKALDEIWHVVSLANRYLDQEAPWALRKTNITRMGTVLNTSAEALRILGILLIPFMPETMGRLLDQLGVPADARGFSHLDPAHTVPPGTRLPAPQGLFPRIEE